MNVSSKSFGEDCWLKIGSKIMLHVNGCKWIPEILLESTDLINQRSFLKWVKYLNKSLHKWHQALIILPG